MATELIQNVVYKKMGNFLVSNELFLDLIFTEKCNCNCKFCIAKTPEYAERKLEEWKKNLKRTLKLFDVHNIIILGGEATIDPLFFKKVNYLETLLPETRVDNVILTTNGIMFRNESFLQGVVNSCINTVNLSYMNYDKKKNDDVMRGNTLTKEEVKHVYDIFVAAGMTMRLNVNVWKNNVDTVEELNNFVDYFNGCATAIKFSPLMNAHMFGVVDDVEKFTADNELSHEQIRSLYDAFAVDNDVVRKNDGVFGLVDYKEVQRNGQHVILKYAQVEDTYDLDTVIPTLKLYPNGALSNEWDYKKNILTYFEEKEV